jgi:hypothetical protein
MFVECAILVSMNRGLVIAGMMKLTAGKTAESTVTDGSYYGGRKAYHASD